ncbi:MAG: hypothetical protein PUE85_10655 [Firmicutes bacterium]|nr:hypothetical protein [Bacillota bacterium]
MCEKNKEFLEDIESWILEFIQGYYGDAWEYIYSLFKFYCSGSDPSAHFGLSLEPSEIIAGKYLNEHMEEVTGRIFWTEYTDRLSKQSPLIW